MLWSSWRSLPALAVTAVAALLGGAAAGLATVDGLSQRTYGPSESVSLFSRADASMIENGPSGGPREPSDCFDCSERDRGYRWAVLASIRYPDQCPADSWGFRRGCLDFVGGI